MAKISSRWVLESEPFDDDGGFDDLIREIRAFSRELQEDNDQAEEREYERQSISIREV